MCVYAHACVFSCVQCIYKRVCRGVLIIVEARVNLGYYSIGISAVFLETESLTGTCGSLIQLSYPERPRAQPVSQC